MLILFFRLLCSVVSVASCDMHLHKYSDKHMALVLSTAVGKIDGVRGTGERMGGGWSQSSTPDPFPFRCLRYLGPKSFLSSFSTKAKKLLRLDVVALRLIHAALRVKERENRGTRARLRSLPLPFLFNLYPT